MPINLFRFVTTALGSILPSLAWKFRDRVSQHCFQLRYLESSSEESPCRTIPWCVELIRLTYSQIVQIFQDTIGGNLWHWKLNIVRSCLEFLNVATKKSNRVKISKISYCIMSANHSKIVVDSDIDLSSSQEPIFFFIGFCVLRSWFSCWIGNSGCSFTAETIFTFRISFGKSFPWIDREDLNSSDESTIVSSLVHNNSIRCKIRTSCDLDFWLDFCERISSWMSKHHVFSSFLKRPCDDHRYSADPFVALAELNAFLEEAKKQTVRELSRKRPDSMGEKFLIASIAFRASRKGHF